VDARVVLAGRAGTMEELTVYPPYDTVAAEVVRRTERSLRAREVRAARRTRAGPRRPALAPRRRSAD
jgi:hypothetical protein